MDEPQIQTPRTDAKFRAYTTPGKYLTFPLDLAFKYMTEHARELEREGGKVVAKVLIWWEEHQWDTCCGGDRNVYNEPPDFVKAAMAFALRK